MMNKTNVKKVLLIVLALGVVFAVANWAMKNKGSSLPTSPTTKPGILDNLKKKFAPAPAPAPVSKPATSPTPAAPISAVPSITPVYQNKVVPPSLTRYSRYSIAIPAGGYVQKLVVAVPASFEFPTLSRSDRAAFVQQTWRDNLFNYVAAENPSGTYLAELTTPADMSLEYSCTVKNRVATCTIQP